MRIVMRHLKRVVAVLMCLVPLGAQAATSPTTGARPMAMGGAFTAVADDGNAPFYNPAGVAVKSGIRLAFTRSALFSGISDPLVAQDTAAATFGVGPGGAALTVSSLGDRDGVYRETALGVGYGQAFGERFRVGALAKIIRAGLDADNPDVAGNSYFTDATDVSATTFDIGALGEITQGLSLGVAARNVLPADLTFRDVNGAESGKAPVFVSVGAAFRLSAVSSAAEQEAFRGILERSLVAVDVGMGDGTHVGAGAEIGVSKNLVFRVGYRSAGGEHSASATTVGAGIAFGSASLDFGVEIVNAEIKDNMNQRLSLRAAF